MHVSRLFGVLNLLLRYHSISKYKSELLQSVIMAFLMVLPQQILRHCLQPTFQLYSSLKIYSEVNNIITKNT